jgi:hypothetical protein
MDTHHNQIGSFSADEIAVLEAGRASVRTLKKTIEIWFSIGRAVQIIRKQADALGGRNAFERLMEQEGFRLAKNGKQGLFQPATITRLLQIMQPDNFTRVVAWHEGLPDHRKIAWASPDSVFKHCPVFGKARPASTAKPQGKAHEKQAQGAELTPQPDDYVRELEATQIEPVSLSMTAQQKLEAYKRQIKRELEAQFEQRVEDEARQWFDHSLQVWCNRFEAAERRIEELNNMLKRHKPILSRRMFRIIHASVQPDKGGTHDVAVEFNAKADVIEAVLCGSKDEHQRWARVAQLPNLEELKAARAKVQAENSARAKRAAATRAARAAAKGQGKS